MSSAKPSFCIDSVLENGHPTQRITDNRVEPRLARKGDFYPSGFPKRAHLEPQPSGLRLDRRPQHEVSPTRSGNAAPEPGRNDLMFSPEVIGVRVIPGGEGVVVGVRGARPATRPCRGSSVPVAICRAAISAEPRGGSASAAATATANGWRRRPKGSAVIARRISTLLFTWPTKSPGREPFLRRGHVADDGHGRVTLPARWAPRWANWSLRTRFSARRRAHPELPLPHRPGPPPRPLTRPGPAGSMARPSPGP